MVTAVLEGMKEETRVVQATWTKQVSWWDTLPGNHRSGHLKWFKRDWGNHRTAWRNKANSDSCRNGSCLLLLRDEVIQIKCIPHPDLVTCSKSSKIKKENNKTEKYKKRIWCKDVMFTRKVFWQSEIHNILKGGFPSNKCTRAGGETWRWTEPGYYMVGRRKLICKHTMMKIWWIIA